MARDIDSYLRELQAAMVSAGADPALVQDALFDAEEYLRAETAAAGEFVTVAEAYGSPEEVAAAYLGMTSASAAPAGPAAVEAGPVAAPVAAPPPPPPPPQPPQPSQQHYGPGYGQTPYASPAYHAPPPGVQAGMAAAAPDSRPRSAWAQVFGVYVDPAVYKAMVYMILSLATGITYFTIVVTGVSTAFGMSALIVGVPLLLLVLGLVRAMALFEGRVVEGLLGTRMPRRERAAPPGANVLERIGFWVRDGRTWASMAYMILMLPLGIAYFTVTITGLAAGLGLISAVAWGWFGKAHFIYEGASYHWWFPAWAIPISVVGGIIVLTGILHLVRLMGQGQAVIAKSMLVRLDK